MNIKSQNVIILPERLPKTTKNLYPEVLTVEDFLMSDIPILQFVLKDLVPKGLTFFAGPPKAGKTGLAMSMAFSIIARGKYLGMFEGSGENVLSIILEGGDSRVETRLFPMVKKFGLTKKLEITTTWADPGKQSIAKLNAWLEDNPETKVVFIDTYAKFTGATKKSYNGEYAAVAGLKEIADKHDAAIIALHHTVKTKQKDWLSSLYGSSGLTGAADTILFFDRERGAEKALLHATGRDIPDTEIALRLDSATHTWEPDQNREIDNLNPERKNLFHIIRNAKAPIKLEELARITGNKKTAISNLLKKLLTCGFIEKSSHGHYQCSVKIV
jgi:RecA-family ATPase